MVEYRQRKAAERAADKGELHRLREELNTANSRVENLVKKRADEVKGLNTLLETSSGNVQKLVEELEAEKRKANDLKSECLSLSEELDMYKSRQPAREEYNTRAEHAEEGARAWKLGTIVSAACAVILCGLFIIAHLKLKERNKDFIEAVSIAKQLRTMYEASQAENARWKTEGIPEENTRLQVVTYAYLDSGVWKSFDDGRSLTVTAWRAND